MHGTYYFLNALSKSLNDKLQGFELADCFSQNREELILSFTKEENELHIIVNLSRGFNAFAFKDEFYKAKSSFTNHFKSCFDKKVDRIVQVPYDRSFYIQFHDRSKILFKMHGNRSNIILFNQKNVVEQLFNSKIKEDLTFELQDLQKARPSITEEINSMDELLSQNLILGKDAKAYLKTILSAEKTMNLSLDVYHLFIKKIDQWNHDFYLNEYSIIPWKTETSVLFDCPLKASNELFSRLNHYHFYTLRKETILKELTKDQKRINSYISKTSIEFEKLKLNGNLKEKADVVMANLHLLVQHEKDYVLDNFYDETTFTIRFKKDEKAQKIAQKWYSKSKNFHKQISHIEDNLAKKQADLFTINAEIEQINLIEDIRALNAYIKSKEKIELTETQCPFKQVFFEGFEILIGRNSKNNDELVKYGHKNDIWLHAKDVSGSHTLIRVKNNKSVSDKVIEFAARLAAYYSKRKSDTLCPVMYTELKYVRKRKGFLPGQVVVEREKVILVTSCSISDLTQA